MSEIMLAIAMVLGRGLPQDGHCLSSPEMVLLHVAREISRFEVWFLLIVFLVRVVRSHPGPWQL